MPWPTGGPVAVLDRSLRATVALGLVLAASSLAADASAAGKKDKEALKLHDQAMDEHYLSVEFDKAAEKLEQAVETCGESDCSPEVVGKLHVALGTVHGVGQGKLDVALEDFKKALAADPDAKLIDGLTTPELEEKFKEARGGAAPAGGDEGEAESEGEAEGEGATSGDFPHEPVAEQAVNTPVPVYVKVPDELGATKVVLRYKPFGGDKWKTVNLERTGAGFGGYIPCADVTTTGEVRYYIIATDESDTPVATAGSTKQPFKVQIKNRLEGDKPSLPGEDAPKKCLAKEDCPPGLPGCGPAGGARGDKGWGASCEQTNECQSGLVCLNGTCEEGSEEGGDDARQSKGAKNLVPVGLQLDLLFLSSGENVCSPTSGAEYACFEAGTSRQYYGFPDVVPEQNGISGGIAMAGVRVLAGYERFLFDDLGLAIGGRIGIAFGGSPSPENDPPTCVEQVEDGETCDSDSTPITDFYTPAGKANGFLPLHLEGRVSYYFLSEGGVEKGGFYPYGFLGGGLAQVNAGVEVAVCNGVTGEASTGCPDQRQLDAYQLTGLGFIGFGGGATYFFHENVGAQAELKMMVMLPTTGFVLAPTLGPVFAF
jgi:hypothetical protein